MPKLMNPLKVFDEFKREWRKKTPSEKWQTVYNLGDQIAKTFVGVRVYSDMKVTFYSYTGGICSIVYFTFVFYTLWASHQRGELLLGMQCTCNMGMLITILAVYYFLFGPRRYRVNNVLKFGGKYVYIDDERQSLDYRNLCDKLVDNLVRSLMVILMIIIISYCMMGFYPLYLIIFKHQRTTILNFEIPFMDNDDDIGFAVNCVVQTFLSYIAFFSNVSIEFGACLSYNVVAAFPDLMHLELQEMKRELRANGMNSAVRLRLRNVFVMCQDFNRFFYENNYIYYWRVFLGPFLFTYAIGFSIFGQFILGVPSGYGCALFNYSLLITFCYIGENCKQSNDRIVEELYNMPWYHLPVTQQKNIRCGIHCFQNGLVWTIGPFAELDFQTASDLSKSVYQFTLMLIRMFND